MSVHCLGEICHNNHATSTTRQWWGGALLGAISFSWTNTTLLQTVFKFISQNIFSTWNECKVIIDAINHSKSSIKALRAAIHTHSITMEAETGTKICRMAFKHSTHSIQVTQTVTKLNITYLHIGISCGRTSQIWQFACMMSLKTYSLSVCHQHCVHT